MESTWKVPTSVSPRFVGIPLFLFVLLTGLSSCVTVKGYEMVNLNDPDMALNPTGVEVQQADFQSYREAAAGANGGKTGGGCGCN